MTQEVTAPARRSRTGVPSSALWLGAFGAPPFLDLAGGTLFFSDAEKLLVAHAPVTYGAINLSFLGGVHWGLAVGSDHDPDGGNLSARLVVGVLTS